MQIVKQSVKLRWATPNAEQEIEYAGRVAHQSEPKGDPRKFIQKLIDLGHESVLEHAVASFDIITDRGISHELVRHRIASYTQESTRYCSYDDEVTVIEPTFTSSSACSTWLSSTKIAEVAYIDLLENSVGPQIARSVLPTCLKTQIVMTANFREWRHFLKLRLSPKAHPQMIELAKLIQAELVELSLACFG